jgi:hypothetical protein
MRVLRSGWDVIGYEDLERRSATPRRITDHTEKWDRLTPVGSANGQVQERLEVFCRSKRITVEGLTALDARVRQVKDGRVELVYAGRNDRGQVTAIKYRPLDQSSHSSYAEDPSTWLRPIIIGDPFSLDWAVAEGETEAARLWDLFGGRVTVLVLPTGAMAFQPEWAAMIPRGARVALCHDADEQGDKGAAKAARILGGRTFRLRPPVEDWCAWDGDREAFLELVKQAVGERVEFIATPVEVFAAVDEPGAEALVTSADGSTAFPVDGLGVIYGKEGASKTTLAVDWAMHFAQGKVWHGVLHPARALRVLVVEDESSRPEFRLKIRRRLAVVPDGTEVFIHVLEEPWATVNLRHEDHRQELARLITELEIDLVAIGPVFAIGMVGAGNADDISAFMTLVTDVRDRADRPFFMLLVHHENKAGDVSGAWGPRPDLMFLVQATEPQHVRMFIRKAKWSSELHGQVRHLRWADGETFEVTDAPGNATEEEVWEAITDYVLTHGGTSWGPVEKAMREEKQLRVDDHTARRVRDRLLEPDGPLVNLGRQRKDGKSNFKLWHREDETAPLEVRWNSTGLSTEPGADSDPGVGRNKSTSPVGPVEHRTPDWTCDLPTEFTDEPPDDDLPDW